MQDTSERELYENAYTDVHRFSFGKNWQNFLKNLNSERIQEAEKSLLDFLGGSGNITGKTFVDIGSGSGLFSLAAHNLGAKNVVSIDVDDFSLSCTALLRKQKNNPKNWEIQKRTALDAEILEKLGRFDIVYSWGVLHHTGDMYKAIQNVSVLLNPKGRLYIAIYNDNQNMLEGSSSFWLTVKKIYNKSVWPGKKAMEIMYIAYYVIGLSLHGINPIQYIKNYTSLRGMNFITDIKDWLGGYPYEYASSETIISYGKSIGLTCIKTNKARSIGCNEFLFIKQI